MPVARQVQREWLDELPADDPRVRCPDITLARNVLGWEPVIDLREGLTRTIAHHRAGLTVEPA